MKDAAQPSGKEMTLMARVETVGARFERERERDDRESKRHEHRKGDRREDRREDRRDN